MSCSLKKGIGLLVLLLTVGVCFAQITFPENDAAIVSMLREHVRFLADDKLEGRLVGSEGEKLAANYIIKNFEGIKLIPKGEKEKFKQPFTFTRFEYDKQNTYLYYEKEFKLGSTRIMYKPTYQQFYPLSFSGYGKVTASVVYVGYGITSKGREYDDYQFVGDVTGKIVVLNLGWPERNTNPEKYARYGDIEAKVELAYKRGAAAVIFINDDSTNVIPKYKPYLTQSATKMIKPIPVVFFPQPNTLENLILNEVTISVDTNIVEFTGNNVIGYIDNKARNTIVIGAHYDHLGYNELGGSTYVNNQIEYPRIHNGADDNASGTAALMVLSKLLSQSRLTRNNYLFVAFSGEEEGLLGSNYFTKNATIDTSAINYMINMDMVGRLDNEKQTFVISGTGTSPKWNEILPTINVEGLKTKYAASGTGSSDHTSFYNIGVPCLHYFTGSHIQYHKPSDDESKINYQGMVLIVKHIYTLIDKLDGEAKLQFTPTAHHDSSGSVSSFKVTLGIMPDYLYEGKGVKVDGVTPGKPASLAGVMRGDYIIQLGDIATDDMASYMKALNKLSKGDTTTVIVKRGDKQLVLKVTF